MEKMLNRYLPKYASFFILIFGVLISGFSFWKLHHDETSLIINEFEKDVDERVFSLDRENQINLEALRSLTMLFEHGAIPSFSKFQRVSQSILVRHNDIQALEWIPRVLLAEKSTFVNIRRGQFPNFEITQRLEQGLMISAKERKEYYPVYYVEPLAGNERALGYDLASNPTRLKTLEESRDSGRFLATASITLVQEKSSQKGVLLFIPIYEGAPQTVSARRKNIKGFILGVFRIGDIFKSSALSDEPPGIDMRLIDGSEPTEGNMLHYHKSGSPGPVIGSMVYHKSLSDFGGRNWRIIATPTRSYVSSRRSVSPFIVGIAGVIFTIFIIIDIQTIKKRAVMVERTVAERTLELNNANAKLELLSRTDGLTGVANRRYFDDHLEKEWLRAMRTQTSISLIFIDIDYFKLYNDNYGHAQGDECLKQVAQALSNVTNRPADLMARYGGEEFAIILPDADESGLKLANSSKEMVERLHIPHAFSKTSNVVTISVGLSRIIPTRGSSPTDLIKSADKALYKAKKGGRNRVERSLS